MLTWRYHLLSLAAVFLALALGVLIGISLSDSGTVNTGQSGLVSNIQHDLDNLRNQNNALSQERGINLRYQEDSFPYLVGSQLQGKRIAIVASDGAGGDIQRTLASAIHGAGGQVMSTTVLNFRFDPAAVLSRVQSDLKSDPQYARIDNSSLIPTLGQEMAKEIGKAGGNRTLAALQGVLVDSSSGRYDQPVDAVVLITRTDDNQTPAYSDLEKAFLQDLGALAVPVVGAEPSDAPRSEIPLFQSLDVSSVDNIDSRIGQVSLVYVLAGEKGAFGVKPTADMLIPILRAPKTAAPGATQPQTPAQPAATTPAP